MTWTATDDPVLDPSANGSETAESMPCTDCEQPVQELDAEVIEPELEPGEESESEPEVFSIADIEKARAEAASANERYLRLQAEWDNYRKRTAREREDERNRAAESLVSKLLPVVDDVERALDYAATTSPEGEYAKFVEGVANVKTKLMDVFAKSGVEAIDPAGQAFDMNEHQAVAQIPDPTVPNETVRDVYQKGYRMGGRVIRTAMVTVTTGGPARTAEAPSEA